MFRILGGVANFSMTYFVLSTVYTDEGSINSYIMVCPPVREIIHSLKLADYLLLQADKPWYNFYLTLFSFLFACRLTSSRNT